MGIKDGDRAGVTLLFSVSARLRNGVINHDGRVNHERYVPLANRSFQKKDRPFSGIH